MRPRLLLLTGPAAGDVAAVLRAATPAADPRQGASCDSWWDEVRDYWEAPDIVAGGGGPPAVEPECGACDEVHPCKCSRDTEAAIRSLPGGEEWLVGLVLKAAYMAECRNLTCGHSNLGNFFSIGCSTCREYRDLPARLAILAPDPPPLLVERVRAWGGDCWHLRSYDDGWCYITFEDGGSIRQMSWLEAVRAALGES